MTQPSLADIEDQKLLEMSSVDRGAKRFYAGLRDGTLAESPAGQRLLREVVGPLTVAIRKAQTEAILAHSVRSPPISWGDFLLLVDADVAAFVTLRAALARIRTTGTDRPLVAASLALADALRLQLEFQTWQRMSKERYKAGEAETDVAREILRRFGAEVTPGDFKRWRARLTDIVRLSWTKPQKLQVGAKLLHLLVMSCDQWFQSKTTWRHGKTETVLSLTPDATHTISVMHAEAALMEPLHLPMTCPPKPWELSAVQ